MSRFENLSGGNAIEKKQLQVLTHNCEISVIQPYVLLRDVHPSTPEK